MRVLIVGADSFAGSFLAEHSLALGDELLGTSLRPAASSAFREEQLDITNSKDFSRILVAYRPEVIYHLAALTFVPECERDFDKALAVNVGGAHNLFRACEDLSSSVRVVFVSSAQVYDTSTAHQAPLTEETPLKPPNKYSLSKAMAEKVAGYYSKHERISVVTMRPFNHIGPRQAPNFVVASFASQLAEIARGEREPIIRVGFLGARRDFVDVRDIVRAYRLAAMKGEGVYNLCSGKAVPINDILRLLISVSGLKIDVQEEVDRLRSNEVETLCGTYARAEKELGWRPEINLLQSLKDIYSYWLEPRR